MDQKTQFFADYLRDRLPVTELCELYGVSRKTGVRPAEGADAGAVPKTTKWKGMANSSLTHFSILSRSHKGVDALAVARFEVMKFVPSLLDKCQAV